MARPGWNAVARAAAIMAALALAPAAWAQAPDQPPPAPPEAHPATPQPHHTVHHHTRRHVHHHARPLVPAPTSPAPVQPPGYSEAPTPNGNLLPPKEEVPAHPGVIPGTLQLHYPPSGEGYVTGSSPQALDDARTAKVPGVTLHLPLQPDAPQPLPPPDEGPH